MPKIATKLIIKTAKNLDVTDEQLIQDDEHCTDENTVIAVRFVYPHGTEDLKKMKQQGDTKTPKHKAKWIVDENHQYVVVLPGNYDGTNWQTLRHESAIPIVRVNACPLLTLTDLILQDAISQAYLRSQGGWDNITVYTATIHIDTDFVYEMPLLGIKALQNDFSQQEESFFDLCTIL